MHMHVTYSCTYLARVGAPTRVGLCCRLYESPRALVLSTRTRAHGTFRVGGWSPTSYLLVHVGT